MRALVPLLLLAAAPAAATHVTGVAVDGAVVTVALDGPVDTVAAFSLDRPTRLVVDLGGVDAARTAAHGAGDVAAARIGPFATGTARLVIDLARPMTLAAAAIDARSLVLRLVPTDTTGFARAVARGRRPVPTTARLIADFDLGDEVFAGDGTAAAARCRSRNTTARGRWSSSTPGTAARTPARSRSPAAMRRPSSSPSPARPPSSCAATARCGSS